MMEEIMDETLTAGFGTTTLLIILAVILFAGFFALLGLAAILEKREQKKEAEYMVGGIKKKSKKSLARSLYNVLDAFPLTRLILHQYEYRLMPLYPLKDKDAKMGYLSPLIRIILAVSGICAGIFLVVFDLNPGFYTFAVSIFLTYALSAECALAIINKQEIKFIGDLNKLLSDITHYYNETNIISAAIDMARSTKNSSMRMIAEEMEDVLMAEDVALAKQEYFVNARHKYLKLFLGLCERVQEEGDTLTNGESEFISSVKQIRSDILEDKRFIKLKRHKFRSLGLTAAIPAVTVPFIMSWEIDTVPALTNFYVGRMGIVAKIVILVVSYLSFTLILTIRSGEPSRKNHKLLSSLAQIFPFNALIRVLAGKKYANTKGINVTLKRMGETYSYKVIYMQKMLCFLVAGALLFVSLVAGHASSKDFYLNDVSGMSEISNYADGRRITTMEELVPRYVNEYVAEAQIPEKEALVALILDDPGIRRVEVANDTADEIIRRVTKYLADYFDFYDVLIIIVGAFLAYFCPGFMLKVKSKVLANRIYEEVTQFQSIINMQSKVPGVLSFTLLESLEDFAHIFKPSIQRCLNEYSIDPQAALDRLYESEEDEEFRKLVDDFRNVEEVGIEAAFAEVASEIKNFRDDRTLEKEILLENESEIAKVIAIIPFGLILAGYLLAPFLIQTVKSFGSYSELMNGL